MLVQSIISLTMSTTNKNIINIKTRLVKFCDKFSLISSNQFGFQQNKSTCDALVNLTENIYSALNNRSHHYAIMVDLRKAFDVVNHEILLKKLEFYGFRGVPLEWFRSYLSNRQSFVQFGKVKSSMNTVNIGVPQGSILGPILFILYVNNITNLSPNMSMTLFADDTSISISNHDFDDLVVSTNLELDKLHN